MLDAAHELLKEGVDIVSGYIEAHARPETSKREEGLEKVWQNAECGGLKNHIFSCAMLRNSSIALVKYRPFFQ